MVGRLILLAAMLCGSAQAQRADAPQPPPLRGEIRTHGDTRLMGQLAPPLALPDGRALLFQHQDDSLVLVWTDPLKPDRDARQVLGRGTVSVGKRLGYSNLYPAAYASALTPAGAWLVGPQLHFIPKSGAPLTLPLPVPRSGATVVGLPDDSLIVMGGSGWPERQDAPFIVERLSLTASGVLQRQELPKPTVTGTPGTVWPFHRGVVAQVGGGRVLIAMPGNSLLYEPGATSWKTVPGLASERQNAAAILLPDGRLWVSGGGWAADRTTSELWDPATRRWQRGPDLPVPMSHHRAAWVPESGVVLLGAGTYPVILGWKPGDPAPVSVAAPMSIERRLGAMLPLPRQQVAVVSGLSARGCCEEHYGARSPGASVMTWTLQDGQAREPVFPIVRDGGLALRGSRLLAVGGRLQHTHEGSFAEEDTRLAELMDLRTGALTTLPPLPFPSQRAGVVWLDDQRALVHAERSGDGTPGGLAVLDTTQRRWQLLEAQALGTYVMSDGVHGRLSLLGFDGQRAWLVGDEANVQWVDGKTLKLSTGPRLQRQRKGLVGRVLSQGRVVVAGGEVEGDLIATRPADCADCAPSYVGWGPMLPSRRHEWFDATAQVWRSSAPSRSAGGPTVILADGRVAKAGLLTSPQPAAGQAKAPDRVLLEVSSVDGQSWRSLPFPPGVPDLQDTSQIRLLATVGEGGRYAKALFLGWVSGPAVTRWWWLPSVEATQPAWRALPEAIDRWVFPPGAVALDGDEGPAQARGSAAGVVVTGR